MGSSRRNSREFGRSGLAAVVSLLIGSAAFAGEQSHNFVLTAYTNGAGGADLVSGKYEAASEALHSRPVMFTSDVSTNSNNRCVALSLAKQWDAARVACDEAVRSAEQERSSNPSYQQYWARQMENDYVAVALSNRAVFHWMSSDIAAAEADLKRAEALAPKSAFVAHNKSALEFSRTSAARVEVAATKSP